MPAPEFRDEADKLICALRGELDTEAGNALREAYLPHLNASQPVHEIDLSSVVAIDSSCLGTFVYLYKTLSANGKKMQLSGVQGQPAEALAFLGLDKIIPIV